MTRRASTPAITPSVAAIGDAAGPRALGGGLRRAWIGYRRKLDEELDASGFGDHGFPDGRVLRICSTSSDTTISQIARELGITRQGASKIVAGLRDRRYVSLMPSKEDGREKIVQLTPRAADYLVAQRKAARKIERGLRAEFGAEALESLHEVLNFLGGDDQPRMRDYIRDTRATLDD
jgi:DNA-binding MarR family transcriptional regulator